MNADSKTMRLKNWHDDIAVDQERSPVFQVTTPVSSLEKVFITIHFKSLSGDIIMHKASLSAYQLTS